MAYHRIALILFLIFFQNVGFVLSQSGNSLRNTQQKIDSIMNNAIQSKAFPGAIVYASRGNSVLINKTYGYHTYDSLRIVESEHLYDLASLTKVMGAGLALMKLYDLGLIQLDNPIRDYVNGFRFGKVGRLTLRECLAHQSGLPSWIPFYRSIQKKDKKYKRKSIVDSPGEKYVFEIAMGMYLYNDFYDRIKKDIKKAKVNPNPEYKYSGLFYYLVPEIVFNVTGIAYEDFLKSYFYDKMKAKSLMFNPLSDFEPSMIVPTEIDSFFRFSPIHGKVHDEGAILMQGVSGNAGLFGNVEDVSKIWRMLLNNGLYEGEIYLNEETVQLFTSYQYPNLKNRRGLSFDKPLIDFDPEISSVSSAASIRSYGHTGYTGTLIWADPAHDLLYIFLSNRVFPTRKQKAIYELNVRPSIHDLIYDLINQSNIND